MSTSDSETGLSHMHGTTNEKHNNTGREGVYFQTSVALSRHIGRKNNGKNFGWQAARTHPQTHTRTPTTQANLNLHCAGSGLCN